MAVFFVIVMLTNILFSLAAASVMCRFNRSSHLAKVEIFLYSAVAGPVLATLFLYYLLIIIPRRSDLFYFSAVVTVFLLAAVAGRSSFRYMAQGIREWFRSGTSSLVFWFLIFLLVGGFLWMYGNHTLHTPLEGHDVLQYAVMGKIYYQEKAIEFDGYRPYEKTGFYSRSSHAPSFPLLATWERLVNGLAGKSQDLYFKSVGAYFGLCILLSFVYHLARRSRLLALAGLLALFSGLGFFLTLITFHLDSYRMFFLLVSWVLLARSLMREDRYLVVLMAMFSGFAAFAHSVGAMVAGLNVLALVMFYDGNWREKLSIGVFAAAIVMMCGGVHYVIDTFWGTGWILLSH